MRRARANWPSSMKFRSGATTARWMPRRCSSAWPAPITSAPATWNSSVPSGRNIRSALQWIDHYGDKDGDGFVEYARYSEKGLAQQGWKDSHDSVFHSDGRLADAPIALCEVQGYVYEAKLRAAQLAHLLGEPAFAQNLESGSAPAQGSLQRGILVRTIGTYALALDGKKKQCAVPLVECRARAYGPALPRRVRGSVAEQLMRR